MSSLVIDQTGALAVSCLSSGIAICFNIAKVTDARAGAIGKPPNVVLGLFQVNATMPTTCRAFSRVRT